MHVGFLIQVIGQMANWHRDGTWISVAVSRVLKESGTHTLGKYNDKRQVTVVDWVGMKKILEVYGRDMGYKGEGSHREPWWPQTAARKQLSDTLEDILAATRPRRSKYRRRVNIRVCHEVADSDAGRNGHWYDGTDTGRGLTNKKLTSTLVIWDF